MPDARFYRQPNQRKVLAECLSSRTLEMMDFLVCSTSRKLRSLPRHKIADNQEIKQRYERRLPCVKGGFCLTGALRVNSSLVRSFFTAAQENTSQSRLALPIFASWQTKDCSFPAIIRPAAAQPAGAAGSNFCGCRLRLFAYAFFLSAMKNRNAVLPTAMPSASIMMLLMVEASF